MSKTGTNSTNSPPPLPELPELLAITHPPSSEARAGDVATAIGRLTKSDYPRDKRANETSC